MGSWFIYQLTSLTALCGFLFGYDTGIISGAIIYVKEEMQLSIVWQEIVVSITIGFAWIFSMFVAVLADRFGRKPVILMSSFVFTIGSLLMGFAFDRWTLLIGRAVVGAAIGFASTIAPIYIAELAPQEQRGSLITVNQCFVTLGLLAASLLAGGFAYLPEHIGWRLMLGFAGIPSLIQFIAFFFMPESPRWLLMKGQEERAFLVLNQIRDDTRAAKDELESIRNSQQKNAAVGPKQVADSNHYGATDLGKISSQKIRSAAAANVKSSRKLTLSHLEKVNWPSTSTCNSIDRKSAVSIVENENEKSVWATIKRILTTRSTRRALLIGSALQMFQQICGINTVMYYSATIIQMSGVHDKRLAIWLSSLTAFVNCIVSFISLSFIDKVRRRTLTLLSLLGVIISLTILASSFQLSAENEITIKSSPTAPFGNPCAFQNRCSACVNLPQCGYCFDQRDELNTATCALISPKNMFQAISGSSCSNGTTENWVWSSSWCPSAYSVISLIGLCLYLVSFAPGLGPMPWLINGELYPTWARSVCNSFTTSINWFFNLLISLTFLSLTQLLTIYGAFWLYAGFGLIGFTVFFYCLPETKDKSIEEEAFDTSIECTTDSNRSSVEELTISSFKHA